MKISLENVVKKFDDRYAIDNLTLDVEQEIFAFLGPNGAGKTTLINILCGLLQRDSGFVSIDGLDPSKDINAIRQKIGLVPQETALYEYLSGKENLEFHAQFYGVPKSERKARVDDALQLAQLQDRANDRVNTYSGGMKRRLALVRALVHDPEILILDEPTLGVDVQTRNEIWNRILKLKKEKLIVITTNYMEEADHLADRCAILDQGKLVALDTPSNLKVKFAGGVRLEAILSAIEEQINNFESTLAQEYPGVKIDKTAEEDTYHIVVPAKIDPNQLLTEISQIFQAFGQIKLINLNVRTPTLNDVFLELTGTSLRD